MAALLAGLLAGGVLAVVILLRGDLNTAAAGFEAAIAGGPVNVREIDIGRIYSKVGRMNEAVGHLQHAFLLDSSCVAFVSESPEFAPYRKDPGVRALLSEYPVKNSP